MRRNPGRRASARAGSPCAESISSDVEDYHKLKPPSRRSSSSNSRSHSRSTSTSTSQRHSHGAKSNIRRKSRRLLSGRRRFDSSIARDEEESKSQSGSPTVRKIKNRKRSEEGEGESDSEVSASSEVCDLVDHFQDSLRFDYDFDPSKSSKGYRLGGSGTRDSLAALARAGKLSTQRGSSCRKVKIGSWWRESESEDLLDLHTGARVKEGDKVVDAAEKLKRQYALLLQISPFAGKYAPWINPGVFLRYLELNQESTEFVWTLPTPQYRLACIRITTSSGEVSRIIRRLRNMSFFHNGLRLRLLVLNHKVVDVSESDVPFMSILQRHSKQSVSCGHSSSHALGLTVEEIAGISTTELVDALGPSVVEIAEAFSCVVRRKDTSSAKLTSEAEIYECLRRALKREFHDQAFRRAMKAIGYTIGTLFAILQVSNRSDTQSVSLSCDLDYLEECKRVYQTYMIEEAGQDFRACKVPLHDLDAILQCMGFEQQQQITSKLDSKPFLYWAELEPYLRERQAYM